MATLVSSTVNLLKTIMGAGLLSMPLAYSTDGLITGTALILLAGLTSGYGLYLQAYSSQFVPKGQASFFAICSITYPALSVVFDIAIAIQCFGVGLSYLVLVGDLMPSILPLTSNPRLFWVLISTIVIIPPCFLRRLDSLKYTSIIGLSAICYIAALIITYSLSYPSQDPSKIIYNPVHVGDVTTTFSIIIFAYTAHQNMFSIINELPPTAKLMSQLTKLIVVSISVAATLFVTVGLAGYYSFPESTPGNIVLAYPEIGVVTVAKTAVVLMVSLSFPLMFYPCRVSVTNIYNSVVSSYSSSTPEQLPLLPNDVDSTSRLDEIKRKENALFKSMTVFLLVLSYVLALSIKSFASVLAVVGATGSTAISFILPGLFAYKLSDSFTGKFGLALSIWGGFVMAVCLKGALLG